MQPNPQMIAEAVDYGTQAQRLTFLKHLRDDRRFTHPDLASYSAYSLNSVKGWFSENADRKRDIPDRAMKLILLETKTTLDQYRAITG